MFKNQKGITLVSLIITIIVLLILAGVSISMTVGSDGIFTKAGTAANEWNSGVKAEENALTNLVNELNKH